MFAISQGAINAAFNQAVEGYEAGDVRKAKRILQFLAVLAPTDAGVWRALARCHEDEGDVDVAGNLRWLGDALAEGAS
jgi:Flp pilus assembly protein TadD